MLKRLQSQRVTVYSDYRLHWAQHSICLPNVTTIGDFIKWPSLKRFLEINSISLCSVLQRHLGITMGLLYKKVAYYVNPSAWVMNIMLPIVKWINLLKIKTKKTQKNTRIRYLFRVESVLAMSCKTCATASQMIFPSRFPVRKEQGEVAISEPLLLTWLNFDPSMDKWSHAQ